MIGKMKEKCLDTMDIPESETMMCLITVSEMITLQDKKDVDYVSGFYIS